MSRSLTWGRNGQALGGGAPPPTEGGTAPPAGVGEADARAGRDPLREEGFTLVRDPSPGGPGDSPLKAGCRGRGVRASPGSRKAGRGRPPPTAPVPTHDIHLTSHLCPPRSATPASRNPPRAWLMPIILRSQLGCVHGVDAPHTPTDRSADERERMAGDDLGSGWRARASTTPVEAR